MFELPMFPGWDAIHPMLIHFPLVLFFAPPVFALAAALTKTETRQAFLSSALIAMFLGSLSMYAAFNSGNAAAPTNPPTAANVVMTHHRELASLALDSLALATLLFGLTLLLCVVLHLPIRDLTSLLPLGSVGFYGLGLYWLVHAAYLGEKLVHEFGVGIAATR